MSSGVTVAQMRLLSAFETHTSVSAVARELGLSQPTVSENLAKLEARLGMQLVERSATGSVLTERGRMIATWARGLIREADDLDRLLTDLGSGDRGRLRVAASMTIAEYLMPHWLLRGGEDGAPAGDVELLVANSEHVMELVEKRGADLGFIEGLTLRPGLHSASVGRDRLTVVVGPAHRWARRTRPLSAEELAGGPLIVREPGSGTREVLERALTRAGLELPERVVTMGSTSAIKTAVRAGDAAGVVSRLAVLDELRLRSLVQVEVEGLDLERRLRAVWVGDVRRDSRMARLIATARSQPPAD